jgi:hypothetical protein
MIGKLGVGNEEQILGIFFCKQDHKSLEPTTCRGTRNFLLQTTQLLKKVRKVFISKENISG